MEINSEACTVCGLCAEVCPLDIPGPAYEADDRVAYIIQEDRTGLCNRCGHCMAVCPSQAIVIDGLSYEHDFFSLPDQVTDESVFFDLLARRRTIRKYLDEQVPVDLLHYILDAISLAPTGHESQKMEITIVQNQDVIQQSLPYLQHACEEAGTWPARPVMALGVQRRGMQRSGLYVEGIDGNGPWVSGSPTLFLFHTLRQNRDHHIHAAIAAMTCGLLAAHALGLAVFSLPLQPCKNSQSDALHDLPCIPPLSIPLALMFVGYPAIHYARGIKRGLPGVHWM